VAFLVGILGTIADRFACHPNSGLCSGIMKDLRLNGCNVVANTGTQIPQAQQEENLNALPQDQEKLHRRMVGELIWLIPTRPDVNYAVKELPKWVSSPSGARLEEAQACVGNI